jgi:hypothetical protein
MQQVKLHKNIPDFLIIGAGKSGTTSLDNYLKQHPQIFIPTLKEPNFFGYELTTIEDLNGETEEIAHFKGSISKLNNYLELFKEAKNGQILGETSNTYLYHKTAPERIKYYNPDMKLIAVFRHPAERLYSRYLHLAREKKLPTPKFEDCFDRNSIWWKRNDLIKEGFYFNNLSKFFTIFPASQIKVYLYEDLNNSTSDVLNDLYGFLGVDKKFEAKTDIRYNESGFIKNDFLDKLYGSKGILQKTAKWILPHTVIEKLRSNLQLQRLINNLKGKNLTKPKMDPSTRKRLIEEVYLDDINKLEKLIGKDLVKWKK